MPVLAGQVDDGAEENGPWDGAERVHEELLEAESDRVHLARVYASDGALEIGQERERVEEHEQCDARE